MYEIKYAGRGTVDDGYHPLVPDGAGYSTVGFDARNFDPATTIAKVQIVEGNEVVPAEAVWPTPGSDGATKEQAKARWGVTDGHFVKETS